MKSKLEGNQRGVRKAGCGAMQCPGGRWWWQRVETSGCNQEIFRRKSQRTLVGYWKSVFMREVP